MISIEDRINFYIGNQNYDRDYKPVCPEVVAHDVPFKTSQDYTTLKSGFVQDVNRYKTYASKDFWVQCGDDSYTDNIFPLLVKVRNTDLPESNGIIANLNSQRHWGFCDTAYMADKAWSNKRNDVAWRGVSTGISITKPKHEYRKNKYTRDRLVQDYFDIYNVAFSSIVQNANHLQKFVKNYMNLQQLLDYKYIISIDGNDKSSSLNWILFSNSVPVMCKPKFHSWLCEKWLEPDVHYVCVKDDFSDLQEKIEWCKDNDRECEQIAKNGQEFMIENFTDVEAAKTIERELIKHIESTGL